MNDFDELDLDAMGVDPTLYADPNMATMDPAAGAALAAMLMGMMAFFVIFGLIFYVYMSLCLMKIAQKTNTENAWLAWIPIANVVLMIQIAKRPMWWIILMFIPLANIVVGIIIWMDLAEAVKKERWWGILMIVPVVSFIVPGYLAFSKSEAGSAGESKTEGRKDGVNPGNVDLD